VTTRIPSLPGEIYDQTAAALAEPLRGAPGFLAHVATVDDDGVTVTELWEAPSDWQAFFEAYVQPNLPDTLPPPETVELRNAIVR
jgi:heme-degrading monooxygenase HmoA